MGAPYRAPPHIPGSDLFLTAHLWVSTAKTAKAAFLTCLNNWYHMLQVAIIPQHAGLAESDKGAPGQWEAPGILVLGWQTSSWADHLVLLYRTLTISVPFLSLPCFAVYNAHFFEGKIRVHIIHRYNNYTQ